MEGNTQESQHTPFTLLHFYHGDAGRLRKLERVTNNPNKTKDNALLGIIEECKRLPLHWGSHDLAERQRIKEERVLKSLRQTENDQLDVIASKLRREGNREAAIGAFLGNGSVRYCGVGMHQKSCSYVPREEVSARLLKESSSLREGVRDRAISYLKNDPDRIALLSLRKSEISNLIQLAKSWDIRSTGWKVIDECATPIPEWFLRMVEHKMHEELDKFVECLKSALDQKREIAVEVHSVHLPRFLEKRSE
jgi:hypothetical protein